jgi:hypothetical protein
MKYGHGFSLFQTILKILINKIFFNNLLPGSFDVVYLWSKSRIFEAIDQLTFLLKQVIKSKIHNTYYQQMKKIINY